MRTFRICLEGKELPHETRVSPVFGHGKEAGISLAHLNAARMALEASVFPCLVLEEDATRCRPGSDIPVGEDWFWVGLSKFSMHGGRSGLWNHQYPTFDGVIDMVGMLALHGVVYGTPAGALRMIECASDALQRRVAIDVSVVDNSLAKAWDRKGFANPWFYQSGKYEWATRFSV